MRRFVSLFFLSIAFYTRRQQETRGNKRQKEGEKENWLNIDRAWKSLEHNFIELCFTTSAEKAMEKQIIFIKTRSRESRDSENVYYGVYTK